MQKIGALIFVVFGGLTTACGEQPAQPCESGAGPGCSTSAGSSLRSYQGRSYQGRSYQGRSYQGTQSGAYAVTEIRIGGVAVTDLRLDGTALVGRLAGSSVRGQDFIGASVTQTGTAGDSISATLAAVETDPTDGSGETLYYALTMTNPDTGAIESMCEPDRDGVERAIPVAGFWDETGAHHEDASRFTFGCTSGVIAKCVRWGYKPWKSVGGVSLWDSHQACTRMARADYCGDGVSHTEDGTLIGFYDRLGVNINDSDALMLFDGAWTPQGAYCIGKERWLRLNSLGTSSG